jgi:hypothetical protein
MIVVCDTSPVNYLVLIDEIDLLPQLFTTVVLPAGVLAELQHPRTPPWRGGSHRNCDTGLRRRSAD